MSKYNQLWQYIANNENGAFELTFEQIGVIAGVPLDHSFLRYKKELLNYGFKVEKISKQFVTKFAINNEVSVFDQILQIAQQFCKKFQKQPQVMDFLFFNPTIIQVYQADKDDFSFLQTIQRLAQQVNPGILNDQ